MKHSEDGYVSGVRIERSLAKSLNTYPLSLPALCFKEIALDPKITFLVGENGSGKSTLIEAVAVAWGLYPEGGSPNFSFATRASHSLLSNYITLIKTT